MPESWQFYGGLILIAALLAILAPKAAINVDELLHYPHAKQVVNWYVTGGEDQGCLNTPVTNLKYYGQSPDNLTALLNRIFQIKNEFLLRHYTGAFFFLILILFSGLLTIRITRNQKLALWTMLALILMPRLSGQAFGNLKDIPFAAGYMAGLFYLIKWIDELPAPRWKTAISLSLAIAFTFSVRAGGLILFAYLLFTSFTYLLLTPEKLKITLLSKKIRTRLIGQILIILITGYFAGLIFWPYALQNVFLHPLESLKVMEHYKISIRQVFDGQMWWSTDLPWYYLIRWFIISTPLIIMAGLALFFPYFIKKMVHYRHQSDQWFAEGIVLFAFLFPFVYVIIIKSNLYSGIRQMIFILPPLAILAVIGIDRLKGALTKKNKITRYAAFILAIILISGPLKHQITTFPADYIYFNMLTGGNKNGWSNYEYDYYFHGIKEPATDLIELAKNQNITVAMNCNLSTYFENHPNIRYQYVRYPERSSFDWDYGIFGINYLHPHLLKNDRWQPAEAIKTYYHKGNPIAILVKRKTKNDYLGISEINAGNLEDGISFLKFALKKDTNNVWLHVQLAKAWLNIGDLAEFQYHINQGKEIHPFYEPILFMEAKRYKKEKRFTDCYEKLEELLDINPRYMPARELYREVKEAEKLLQQPSID